MECRDFLAVILSAERSPESKDLRTIWVLGMCSVRGSFAPLCSLRVANGFHFMINRKIPEKPVLFRDFVYFLIPGMVSSTSVTTLRSTPMPRL